MQIVRICKKISLAKISVPLPIFLSLIPKQVTMEGNLYLF